jgi:hypothetical protein
MRMALATRSVCDVAEGEGDGGKRLETDGGR